MVKFPSWRLVLLSAGLSWWIMNHIATLRQLVVKAIENHPALNRSTISIRSIFSHFPLQTLSLLAVSPSITINPFIDDHSSPWMTINHHFHVLGGHVVYSEFVAAAIDARSDLCEEVMCWGHGSMGSMAGIPSLGLDGLFHGRIPLKKMHDFHKWWFS